MNNLSTTFRTLPSFGRGSWPNFFINGNPWEGFMDESEPVEKIYEYSLTGIQYNQIDQDDTVTLEIALPGVSKESIDIETKEYDSSRYIRVKQKEAEKQATTKDACYIIKKIPTSHFEIIFEADHRVATERMSVSLKDGILTIILPKVKQKEENVKKVSIQ